MTVSQGVLVFIAIIATAAAAGCDDQHNCVVYCAKSVDILQNQLGATSEDDFQRQRVWVQEEAIGVLKDSNTELWKRISQMQKTIDEQGTLNDAQNLSITQLTNRLRNVEMSNAEFRKMLADSQRSLAELRELLITTSTAPSTSSASSPLPTPPTIPAERRIELSEALYGAAKEGDAKIIRELVAQGADMHYRGYNGATPLHEAAWYNKTEALKALIQLGAPLEAESVYKTTPLHYAMYGTCEECVKALLSAGANINARNKNGETPLHFAVQMNSQSIVEMLIAAGADKSVRDDKGRTPKDLAESDTLRALLD